MKKLITLVIVAVALQLALVSATYAQGGDAGAAGGGYGGGGYGGGGYGGGGGYYHTVQWGETLFSLGRRYGVYPYHIADVNGLHNPNHIYAGQILYIPPGSGWNDGCGSGCGNCGNQGCNWQNSSNWGGCGNRGCGNQGNCGNQGCWNQGGGNHGGGNHGNCGNQGCWNQGGWNHGSGNHGGCGNQGCGSGYYGYDYTGYYYGNYQDQYSHTCGYYYNCW